MILVKTTTPTIIDAISLHSNSFIQKNTQLCTFNTTLSADFKLSFANKTFEQSANPLSALRDYMQEVILLGPQLDPQTLSLHVDRILSLPPQMIQPLIRSLDDDFNAAGQRRLSNADDFRSKLANLLNQCGGPCNYFKPVGDVVALMSNSMQQNTNNVSPIWDGTSTAVHAPLNIAGATLNKISTTAQQLVASLATATKSVIARATTPVFTDIRKQTELALMEEGKSMSFTPHGSYLSTDPFPYFQTQNNASNLLARARGSLNDCFRLHEFKYRYNPLDPNMNLSVATNSSIVVRSEGSLYNLNVFGKSKVPTKKPAALSIREYLDWKESKYDWDDVENWTRYPNTGRAETEKEQPTPAQKPKSANTTGSRVTDYGQPTDPYADTNSMRGIGMSGIGEGKGPANLKGGPYLLRDYSMAVSPDVEAQMRSAGIQPGDWVNVQTADGRTFAKRWDDRTSSSLTGRVDFYSPIGRASGLNSSVISIQPISGPPAGYIQPPRYVYGVEQGYE